MAHFPEIIKFIQIFKIEADLGRGRSASCSWKGRRHSIPESSAPWRMDTVSTVVAELWACHCAGHMESMWLLPAPQHRLLADRAAQLPFVHGQLGSGSLRHGFPQAPGGGGDVGHPDRFSDGRAGAEGVTWRMLGLVHLQATHWKLLSGFSLRCAGNGFFAVPYSYDRILLFNYNFSGFCCCEILHSRSANSYLQSLLSWHLHFMWWIPLGSSLWVPTPRTLYRPDLWWMPSGLIGGNRYWFLIFSPNLFTLG